MSPAPEQSTSKRRPAAVQDEMIAKALRAAARPVSAYELIEQLRATAVLAPQTVYRSLDRLIAAGRVHRLESLNAFVACQHTRHEGVAMFAICDTCKAVEEFADADVVARLGDWARRATFAMRQVTLELRGTCADCTPPVDLRSSRVHG